MVKEKEIKSKLLLVTGVISIIISSSVLFGWSIGYEPILSLIPGSATMKVNTAIIFLFGGINLLLLKNKNTSNFYVLLNIIISLIGIFTLVEYISNSNLSIDNLLILDNFSIENPGRMSPATAFSAILLSISFLTFKIKNDTFQRIGLLIAKSSLIISFIAIVSFLFAIPSENRTSLYKTMAIHTSVLYFAQVLVLILNHKKSILSKLLFSNYNGSLLFKKALPVTLLFPLIFCYILLISVNDKILSVDFGLTTYIVISIPLTIITLGLVSFNLNKVNKKEISLNNSLKQTNNNLKLFKSALDKAAIVYITDKNGNIKYVNKKYLMNFGYDRNELIKKKDILINPEYIEPSLFSEIQSFINKGEIWEGIIKSNTKYGVSIWLESTIVPFKDENGDISEIFSIMYNVTQRVQAEEITKNYIKEIEYKNEELEQYTYITSHDLQEPLNTIIGYVDIFNEKYKSQFNDIDKKILGYLVDASQRMKVLIKNLLDYGRIGKNIKIEKIDCNTIIENIKKDLATTIEIKNAKISYKNLPTIYGEKINIHLLFQNLISNALKFIRKDTIPEISISSEENSDFWTLIVKDNGIGIEKKHLPKIFKIFQRLHNINEYEGTGIGLAHCKKIVDLHKGKIWVESSKNSGSTFYFTISKKLKTL